MNCRCCEEPKPKKKVVAKPKAPAKKKKIIKKK